jgi:hypothetical protein
MRSHLSVLDGIINVGSPDRPVNHLVHTVIGEPFNLRSRGLLRKKPILDRTAGDSTQDPTGGDATTDQVRGPGRAPTPREPRA